MTFLELAEKILIEEKKPLTAIEIWNIATTKGYEKQLNSQGKTPWATLGAQIYVNSKDDSKSIFAKTDSRPKKFYLKSMANHIDLEDTTIPEDIIVDKKKKFKFLEKDLHKYLSYFAYYHLNCYTKTIKHNISSKKEFGEWVHPDMVGCYFRMEDWKKEVYDFSNSIGVRGIVIYSFELKRELSFSNLRESFFQCVSNSSWANESYLVTSRISENDDFMEELSRLSTSFGIGIIELNVDDPDSSEIIIPAKYKQDLDFETINKLAMNTDFKDFIETVKIDLTSKKIHKKEYDFVDKIDNLKTK
ncbi:COG2958 family protein [uncultured Chryseobacterium sp.]|uniref:COG2958 family protein n=2 Tax=uncultured Chryseobacterium sp. TaxID=259322 RepID=UPI0025FD4068|nr:HTH domain-containing protein [uncultured Chryseobacterium sp.]